MPFRNASYYHDKVDFQKYFKCLKMLTTRNTGFWEKKKQPIFYPKENDQP